MWRIPDCSHKRAYETEEEAEQVAEHQMAQDENLSLRVYYCQRCSMYHLTHKPRRF